MSIFSHTMNYAQTSHQVSKVGNFGMDLVQQEFYDTGTLNYLLFMPEDTSAMIDGKFPLLVSLHGIGDRGNNLQLLKRDGMPKILDGYRTFPFIVLSPQCPESTEWYYDRTDKLTVALINEIISKYPVDPDRIYVTGYSMGGIGTYDLAIRYPGMFAAVLPIAARAEAYWNICDMKEVPTWAFHGNLDPLVPLHKGQFVVSVLRNCGCNINFTVYDGVYHNSWSQTYDNPAVYEWLLKHSKSSTRAVCIRDSLIFYGAGEKLKIADFGSLSTYSRKISLPEEIFSLLPITIDDVLHVIAGGEQYFHLIDAGSSRIISSVNTGGVCEGLAAAGTYLYVAAGSAGLKIYQLANPHDPTFIAAVDSLAYCESVLIDSSYACIAAGGRSYILDISNPAEPAYVSKIVGFGGHHEFVNVKNSHAYICDSEQGIQVIDIRDPYQPVNVKLLDTGKQTSHIMFRGNEAYVANGYEGMRIMDISDAANPRELNLLDTPGQALNAVSGSGTIDQKTVQFLLIADLSAGICAVDITDPLDPKEIKSTIVQPPANTAYGSAYDVFVSENKAYIAYAENGLRIADISRPEKPSLLGSYKTDGNIRDVVVKGHHAYAADLKAGLLVLDVSDPAHMVEVNLIQNYRIQELIVSGDRIYVAAGDSGVIIFDVADPAQPDRIGAVSSVAARSVAISGTVLGISDYQKIYFFDISDPVHPVQLSETAPLSRGNEGFVIEGENAYVPDGDSLRIFDISDVTTPALGGVVYTGGYGYDIAVSGDYAYIAADRKGLRAVDISDVARPLEVGFYDDTSLARGIAADSLYIYVAEKEGGLSIYRNDFFTPILTDEISGHPIGFILHPNYPNPFNPVTTIAYELGAAVQVTLEIYNTMGQRLLILVDASQPAGRHELRLDARNFASGVYFCRFQAGRFIETNKLLILK